MKRRTAYYCNDPLMMVERFSGFTYTHPTTTHFADSDPPFNRTVHIVSTLFLTTSTLILALILPNISVVFGLLGGTASSWLGFCVPGLLGIQLYKNECASGMPPRYRLLLTSWALLAGGIVVGVLTTGVTIYNTILHWKGYDGGCWNTGNFTSHLPIFGSLL